MTTHKLPQLEIESANYWHRSLQALANELDLDYLLDAATTAPQDPTEYTAHKRKQERLTLIILASLPKRITKNLTDANLQLSPHLLTQHVLNMVQELTSIDHSLLESQARNIQLTSITNVEDFLSNHEQMRITMRNANYPRIAEENTTIQFMINGINNIPELHSAHQIMIQTPPQTISEFSMRLSRAATHI